MRLFFGKRSGCVSVKDDTGQTTVYTPESDLSALPWELREALKKLFTPEAEALHRAYLAEAAAAGAND